MGAVVVEDDPGILARIEQQKDTAYREEEMTPELRVMETVRKAHAPALRQLRERVQVTEGHAKDAMRWLAADMAPQKEPRWRLKDAQMNLARARKSLEEAERALEEYRAGA
jgi:hypothetical protein